MKSIIPSAIALLAFAATACAEPEWKSIFNGENLDGWDGDPRLWTVEKGVLIGETDADTRKIPQNSFLIWQGGEQADFELEFKARITTANNSGVQYRSRKLEGDGWRVVGYQLDLHPRQQYNAMLYEEGGRGIVAERGQHVRLGKQKEVVGKMDVLEVDLAEWQSFRLVVKGHRYEHYVNGQLQTVIEDEDEEKRADSGIIALQLHQGAPMKVEFKEIRFRPL
ncbi:MAG: DUF1080 domain-containing protein [Luteolibacter sp.]